MRFAKLNTKLKNLMSVRVYNRFLNFNTTGILG